MARMCSGGKMDCICCQGKYDYLLSLCIDYYVSHILLASLSQIFRKQLAWLTMVVCIISRLSTQGHIPNVSNSIILYIQYIRI